MKIGIDIRNIGKKRTGDEVVFFNLTKNLAQIDQKNEYVLCTDIVDPVVLENIATLLEIRDKANFQIVSLKTKNRFTWNFWTLKKYLRKNPVDIYLTQYITPFFVPKKIKIATIVHDVSFNVFGRFIKFSDLFFLKILMPLSMRRADKIIGVSQFTVSEILKYYDVAPQKTAWFHNAVGDNFQKSISPEQLATVREKYHLPEKFILYIGTMQPRKNLPILVEAYAELAPEIRADIKLVLAGGKGHNYDQKIEEAINKSSLQNDILFTGFVDEEDKPAIFKCSTLYCSPSLYEGFGITILEAMTLGIPVIASEIPPHREVAEESIIFFDPADSADLSKDLDYVIKNETIRKDLTQKGLAQAKKFDWQKTAQKLLDIFISIEK